MGTFSCAEVTYSAVWTSPFHEAEVILNFSQRAQRCFGQTGRGSETVTALLRCLFAQCAL